MVKSICKSILGHWIAKSKISLSISIYEPFLSLEIYKSLEREYAQYQHGEQGYEERYPRALFDVARVHEPFQRHIYFY